MISVLLLTSRVLFGGLVNLSEPQFPHLCSRANSCTFSTEGRYYCRDSRQLCIKGDCVCNVFSTVPGAWLVLSKRELFL